MIPLSVPHLDGNEWKYVKECIDTGWISSAGSFVNRFENDIALYTGARYGVACMNGTVGLHVSQRICGINQNDLVITPNITFIATLNSIAYSGAKPILIDVDLNSWQIDLDLLAEFLETETEFRETEQGLFSFHIKSNKRIPAIIPVHVLGNMCNMDKLIQIAEKHKLIVIEDSTESLGSTFHGKHSGTFGELGVFSFNGNKIISTGGGGVIITNDEHHAKTAKHLTTQAKASDMEYIHDEIGYNYRLVNVLAAIGVAQMEKFPELLKRKKEMDAFYRRELKGVGDIAFQEITEGVDANCWLFTFRTSHMRGLLEHLNKNGAQSRPFWMPMNQLDMFKNDLYFNQSDVSAKVYETSISIPSSAGIKDNELEEVVRLIKQFYQ